MKYIITSIMLWFVWIGVACDNCNVYLNISPNDYQNSVGLFMRQRMMLGEYNLFGEMTSTLHSGHGNDKAFWGNKVFETYQTYELRGNFYYRERWKTTVILRVVNNSQRIDDFKRYEITGVGDPIVLQAYQLYNTIRDTSNQNFFQRVSLGGGLKLPLGKTNLQYEQGTPNLDLQPGSGSWDLIGFLAYSFKWHFIGLSSNANYKLNGRNQSNYRYGNVLNVTANLFADISIKKLKIRLSSGALYEEALFDRSYLNFDQDPVIYMDTGGKMLFANAGIRFFLYDFILFGEYQKTIKSELNGYTQLLTRDKFNVGLSYTF